MFENNELIGFFCVIEKNTALKIGFGLRPDIYDKGNGKQFVSRIIDFIEHNYNFDKLIMNVASFNQRTIKVYRAYRFENFAINNRLSNGGMHEFLTLVKEKYNQLL